MLFNVNNYIMNIVISKDKNYIYLNKKEKLKHNNLDITNKY